MNAALRYSLLRILIFLACLLVLWLVGLKNPLWLLLTAATVSMLISAVGLSRMRDRMSEEVAEHVERRRAEKVADRRRRGRISDEDAEDAERAAGGSDAAVVENPDAFR